MEYFIEFEVPQRYKFYYSLIFVNKYDIYTGDRTEHRKARQVHQMINRKEAELSMIYFLFSSSNKSKVEKETDFVKSLLFISLYYAV